jgi:hypothetical protein
MPTSSPARLVSSVSVASVDSFMAGLLKPP